MPSHLRESTDRLGTFSKSRTSAAGFSNHLSARQEVRLFPNRRIYVVLPYPAGSIGDVSTRIVTDKLSEIWHQPIVIEAKPAAQGNLAWDEVSRAKPDGYTWTFLGPATMANPRMYANLRWREMFFDDTATTVWLPNV